MVVVPPVDAQNQSASPAPTQNTNNSALASETEHTKVYLVVCPPGASPEECETTRLS